MPPRARIVVGCVLLIVAAMAYVALRTGAGATPPPPSDERPRIAVLSPALAVTMVDLGLEPRIVGRHGWDYVLDPSIPICGDQSGIDYESLVGVEPTHVVLEWGRRELPRRLVSLGDERGWAIVNIEALTLQQVGDSVAELARLFERQLDPQRPELVGAAQLTGPQIVERMIPAGSIGYAGRVLLLTSTDPPAAMGPGSFHQDALERMGGRAAITEGAAYVELDAEDVLDLAPDAIVLLMPRPVGAPPVEHPWDEIERTLGVVATLPIPAVEHHRVAVIDHPLVLTPSTAMIDYAHELREALADWE